MRFLFTFKHRLFFHQQWNAPESIQARNKDVLIAEGKLRQNKVADFDNLQPSAKRRKPFELEPVSRGSSAASEPAGYKSRTSSAPHDDEMKPTPVPPSTPRHKTSSARSRASLTTSIKGCFIFNAHEWD